MRKLAITVVCMLALFTFINAYTTEPEAIPAPDADAAEAEAGR